MRSDYCPIGGEPCQSVCAEPCSVAKKAKPHKPLITQLLDPRVPKTEREHAGVFRVSADDLGRMLAAERERCAKAVELLAGCPTADEWLSGWNEAIAKSADAIRKGIE